MVKIFVEVQKVIYDKEKGTIILNCYCPELETNRIFCVDKRDYYSGDPNNPVSDAEMEKTASMFEGKKFYLEVRDDPNTKKLSKEELTKYENMFKNEISDLLQETRKEYSSDEAIMKRKLQELLKSKKDYDDFVKDILKSDVE